MVREEIQALLDKIEASKPALIKAGFKMTSVNAREGLANTTAAYVFDEDEAILSVDDVVPAAGYDVPVRIYIPGPAVAAPLAVFIHGGGHMCGGILVYDKICRKLARATGHIVVAPEYRLSPEWPYPCGINDCIAVVAGIRPVLLERGIKVAGDELALIGDSGGAAVCTSICMSEENITALQINKLALVYPSVDYTMTQPSVAKFGYGYLLEQSKIAWYFNQYFQNNEDRVQVSPLYNPVPKNMPSTMIILAEYDPLYDEGFAYGEKLVAAGVSCECLTMDGVIHAYLMLEDLCIDECKRTYQEIGGFLNKKD